MKKILIVSPAGLPIPATKGGAVETLMETLINLNEKEKLFSFLVLTPFEKEAYKAVNKYKCTNFKFFAYKISKIRTFFFKVLRKFQISIIDTPFKKEVYKYLKKNTDYDFVLFEAGETFSLVKFSKIIPKEKLLIHAHWNPPYYSKYDHIFKRYIGVSDFITNQWRDKSSMSNDYFVTLKNRIKVDNFNKTLNFDNSEKIRNKFCIKQDDFVIIYTGRIIPEKGIKQLLEAVCNFDDRVKLIIVGSANFGINTNTSFEFEIKKLVEKHSNKIIFTGYVKNDEIYKYYSIADVSCVPTLYDEPAGLVIMEAMSAGKFILSTATGGMKEYLNDECYYKLELDNVKLSIMKGIEYCMNNLEEINYLGKRNKEMIKEFDDNIYLDDFKYIIDHID